MPFNSTDSAGIVYGWIGRVASPTQARLMEDLISDMFGDQFSVQVECHCIVFTHKESLYRHVAVTPIMAT